MSTARVQWEGLEELRAALQQLPAHLTAEASLIVQRSAERAAEEIVAAYPDRTGNLRKGVRVRPLRGGRFAVGTVVRNRAPHAAIFEYGTQARHTALGANRGAMPPGDVFVPRIIRYRRWMYDQLRALLGQVGFQVSGDA